MATEEDKPSSRALRYALVSAVVLATAIGLGWATLSRGAGPEVIVFYEVDCSCCVAWADHMRSNGFRVEVQLVSALEHQRIRDKLHIGPTIDSCHTAVVEQYALEGHVPAAAVRRLLDERPPVAGLAVPDMPIGAPGMGGRYEEPYDVLAFHADGGIAVFESR